MLYMIQLYYNMKMFKCFYKILDMYTRETISFASEVPNWLRLSYSVDASVGLYPPFVNSIILRNADVI